MMNGDGESRHYSFILKKVKAVDLYNASSR